MEDFTAKQAAVITALRARISEFEGTKARPQPGCLIARMPLGVASVLVEYENAASRDERPVVFIVNVLINSMWVDAHDCIGQGILDQWEGELTTELMADAYSSAIEAAEFNRELARDLAYDLREAA